MKRFLIIIFIVVAFIINPFDVSAAAEEEWKNNLNLSDSVSSSIIELDDGVVVMRYEGNASENSTLIKYDFDGNEIWSMKNDYGFEMGTLGDSFLVFTTGQNFSITKISSDGEIVWSKQYDNYSFYFGDFCNVVDFDSGFLIYDSYHVYSFDNNGNLLKGILGSDVANSVFGSIGKGTGNLTITLSNDKKSILIFITSYRFLTGRGDVYYQVVAKYSLDLTYQSSVRTYSGTQSYSYLTKIIETDNNYVVTGNYTLIFNKDGQLDKVLNVPILDIEYIDGYVYAYVCNETDNFGIYQAYIIKYDENMKEVMRYPVPFTFDTGSDDYLNNSSSFAYLKNRSIFYYDSDGVHLVALNTPLVSSTGSLIGRIPNSDSSYYNVSQYRLSDDNSNNATDDNDGIIYNIFQNPETSSIVVVIAFVIVILLGGIGFYFGYRKKKVKNM